MNPKSYGREVKETTRIEGKTYLGLQHWQVIAAILIIYDLVAVNASFLIALWIRFDGQFSLIPTYYFQAWIKFSPFYSAVSIVVFWVVKLYRSMWRFAGFDELVRIVIATFILGAIHTVGITCFVLRMPISYYAIGLIVQFILVVLPRFGYRFVLIESEKRDRHLAASNANRVMLVGAGKAGRAILGEMHGAKELNDRVVCIIDDNPNKWNRLIDGVPIVGGRDDIMLNVKKYNINKIVFTIPSATAEEKRDILNICKETGCELKSLPGMYQLVSGDVHVTQLQNVEVEDLLGRKPIQVNTEEILNYLKGKTIMVTGGGGSIGSELCRQIAKHEPKQLIIFDVYENNAHAIRLELEDAFRELDLVVLIGSVRDTRRLDQVFEKYKPDIVFHAAAHKHVPLMEASPKEAIKNNAIGTFKTAYAAMKYGAKRFVLISTDKAVNPTNIMGASKRLCEMVIQSFNTMITQGRSDQIPSMTVHSDVDTDVSEVNSVDCDQAAKCTEFVAVRFGNVLGSNGSVVPRFREQIMKGGPVTVTHPDIIRYFMTIPEAASLVLQAGTYAKGGEIFVLDMGAPVRIDSLARNMIKLSGFTPDVDIKIEYTGLRPGEKLYEEKLMNEEGMGRTPNNLIHIGKPIPFDVELFWKQLQWLMEMAYSNCDDDDIKDMVASVVSTYHPAGEYGTEEMGAIYKSQIDDMKKKKSEEN